MTHRATAAGYHYLIRDLQTNQDIINGRVWGQRNEQRITGDANIHARNLPIGRYRFWIRAEGIDGTFGNWSSGHNFVIGTGPSLNSGNTDTFDRRPLFTWNALPGATSYELTLINANNGQVVHAPTGIIGTGWSPVSNLTNGPYRVYTRAAGPGGFRTLASETSTFFVGGRPTVAFGMLGGKDGVPGLAFESVTGASRYHVPVDRVGGPVRVIYDLNVAVRPSQFSLGALAPGQYRAWVRAVSATGENSPWSLEVMFQITHNDNARDNNGDDDALLASLDILLPPNIRPTSALSASEVDRRASVSLAEDSADEITPPATTGTLPVPGPAFRAMIPTSEEAVEPADLLWPAVDWMFAVETRKGLLPWTDSAV